MKTQIKRIVKNKSGKQALFMYAVLALVVMMASVAVVQLVPGGSDDSSAADHTINLTSPPASNPGLGWTLSGAGTGVSPYILVFNTNANSYSYELTGGNNLYYSIQFQASVNTTVTLNNISIRESPGIEFPIHIEPWATVTLLLSGTNELTKIYVPTNASLIIDSASSPNTGSSDGTLSMSGATNKGAAIGGATNAIGIMDAGNITIKGGTVNANAHFYGAAGIGGGGNSTSSATAGSGGNITITGGTVNALGNSNGTGIGGGGSQYSSGGRGGDGGTINISGNAVVNATGRGGAGIGGGFTYLLSGAGGAGGTINISGDAVVNATTMSSGYALSNTSAAAIGGGSAANGTVTGGGDGGNITISGNAVVTATGGGSAGIGGGAGSQPSAIAFGGSGGTVIITDNATVIATGNSGGAGIGGGAGVSGGSIFRGGAGGSLTVTGNAKVTATSNGGGAGIGAGSSSPTQIGLVVGTSLSISSTADVKAYSQGTTLPAIHAAGNISGGGYVTNANLIAAISGGPVTLEAFIGKNMSNPPTILNLPGGFRGFAYSTGGSSTIDRIYATNGTTYTGIVVRDSDNGDPYSMSILTDYNIHNSSAGNGVLPVRFMTAVPGTPSASNILYTTADINSNGQNVVTGVNYVAGGFLYSASSSVDGNGALNSSVTDLPWSSWTTSQITENLTGLSMSTTYYVQTYLEVTISSIAFTFYSPVVPFTTDSPYTDVIDLSETITSTADYTISAGMSPYSVQFGGSPGGSVIGDRTLTFSSAADGNTYLIKQTGLLASPGSEPKHGTSIFNEIFIEGGVSLTLIISDIDLIGSIILENDAEITLLIEGDSYVHGSILAGDSGLSGVATITIDSYTNPGSSDDSLTVTTSDLECAAIGGASTQHGGFITIEGGTITATAQDGAGIGGGASSSGSIGGGDGGVISINSGTITATSNNGAGIGGGFSHTGVNAGGGSGVIYIYDGTITATSKGGAGIGGGSASGGAGGGNGTIYIYDGTITASSGMSGYGANGAGIGFGGGTNGLLSGSIALTLNAEADVRAYAVDMPAIHISTVTGTGYFVNATLNTPIASSDTTMDVYANGTSTVIDTFTLPADFMSFAYSTGAAPARLDNIKAYDSSSTLLGTIVRVHDDSPVIGSITAMNGYNAYNGGVSDARLPVKLAVNVDISGTIYDNTTGTPVALGGVTVYYMIGSTTYSVLSNATTGEYEITVPSGSNVTITGLSKSGYIPYPVSQFPDALGTVSSDMSSVDYTMVEGYVINITVACYSIDDSDVDVLVGSTTYNITAPGGTVYVPKTITSITLTANEGTDYFESFYVAETSDYMYVNPTKVAVNSDLTIIAHFGIAAAPYIIDVTIVGDGIVILENYGRTCVVNVSPSKAYFPWTPEDNLFMTAVPATGMAFDHFDTSAGTNASNPFVKDIMDVTYVTAYFDDLSKYNVIEVTIYGDGSLTIDDVTYSRVVKNPDVSGPNVSYTSTVYVLKTVTSITITAVDITEKFERFDITVDPPSTTNRFDSYMNPTTVPISTDLLLDAYFEPSIASFYVLTVNIVGNGTVSVEDNLFGPHGTVYTSGTTINISNSVSDVTFTANNGTNYFEKFVVDTVTYSGYSNKVLNLPISANMAAEATFGPMTSIDYVAVDGSTQNYGGTFTVIDSAYFGSGNQTIPAGWYYVVEDVTVSGVLFINGDANIVIANNATLTVAGSGGSGLQVQTGNNLAIYSEPHTVAADIGKVEIQQNGIHFAGTPSNRTFINTAFIDGMVGMGNTIDSKAVNGVTGTIHSALIAPRDGIIISNSGTIHNYGLIIGTANGINVQGSGSGAVINNYAFPQFDPSDGSAFSAPYRGTISGVNDGIQLIANGTVSNHGTIVGTGPVGNGFGIYSNSTGVIINNHAGGVIQGDVGSGIRLGNGGTIGNSGTISSTSTSPNASGINSSVVAITVNNQPGGVIQGLNGLYLSAGGTVNNYGAITGSGTSSNTGAIYSSADCTILNYASGTVEGGNKAIHLGNGGMVVNFGDISGKHTTSYGIYLDAGGEVSNSSTISGVTQGIFASSTAVSTADAVILTNSGAIHGNVTLANAPNEITLTVDSLINGNFSTGTNPGTTLDFSGTLDPVDLTFATITGNSNIGTANVYVSFSAPPTSPPYTGADIILIDGSTVVGKTVTGTPKNPTYTVGGYTFSILVGSTGDQLIATLGIDYVEVNGSTSTHSGSTTVIDSTSSGITSLAAGWYYVTQNVTISSLTISGNVQIIIANGVTLTVTNGITVPTGSNLSVYSQPPAGGSGMGKLSMTGAAANNGINITGNNCTVINTASIESSRAVINGVGTGVKIVNGITGILKNAASNTTLYLSPGSTGTINNYGSIEAVNTVPISFGGVITVNNYAFPYFDPSDGSVFSAPYRGSIKGVSAGIILSSDSTGSVVHNYGDIEMTIASIGLYAAVSDGGGNTIYNHAGGVLEGVRAFRGSNESTLRSTLNNAGTITGGTISNACGVYFVYGGDLINSGTITGGIGVYGNFNSHSYIDNSGTITGTGSRGIDISCSLDNTGTITGQQEAVRISVPVAGSVVNNSGTITAVASGSWAMSIHATNAVGSGNATINNSAGGVIKGTERGLSILTEGTRSTTVNNYGEIEGTSGVFPTSSGIYVFDRVSPVVTITNYSGGSVKGGSCGVYLGVPGTIVNNGDISGMIVSSFGIYLLAGGSVTNNNTIGGAAGSNEAFGIYGESDTVPTTLVNNGSIYGNVTLGNAENDITFVVNSLIVGNFTPGGYDGTRLKFAGDLDLATTPFTYAKVTGTSTIGINVYVSFDGSGLPTGYAGEDLVLIDGSGGGAVGGASKNPTYITSGYGYFIETKGGNQLVATTGYIVEVTFVGDGTVQVISGSDGTTVLGSVSGTTGDTEAVVVRKSVGSILLKAIPDSTPTQYYFEQFEIDGGAPSIINPTSTAISANMEVTVTFVTGSYYTLTVTAGANGSTYADGVLVPAGTTASFTYADGASATLTVTPSGGYALQKWTLDTVDKPAITPYVITMDADHTAVSFFTTTTPGDHWILTVTAGANGSTFVDGVLVPAGSTATVTYADGDDATMTATPATGYALQKWVMDTADKAAITPYVITMGADHDVESFFVLSSSGDHRTLTVTAGADGSTFVEGILVPVGTTVTVTYADGDDANLTVIPDSGFAFDKWTLDTVDKPAITPYVITMDADHTAVSFFTTSNPGDHWILTVTAGMNGSTFVDGVLVPAGSTATVTYADGDDATMTATPATGYALQKWTLDSADKAAITPYVITMGADHDVESFFTLSSSGDHRTLTVTAGADGSTFVEGILVPATTTAYVTYADGASANLTATPDSGFAFDKWTLDGADKAAITPYVITMDTDYAVASFFTTSNPGDHWNLTVTAGANGSTFVEGILVPVGTTATVTYADGDNANLTATTTSGYVLQKWTLDTVDKPAITPYVITMDADHAAVSFFTTTTAGGHWTLTVTAGMNGSTFVDGVLVPAGTTAYVTYADGDDANMTATPASGHILQKWTLDAADKLAITPYIITMDTDHAVESFFTTTTPGDHWNLTVTAGADGSTFVEGILVPVGTTVTVTYADGDDANLTVIP
ncbi:MAG: hypothetical protein FWG41_00830, partial [Methanomassiliicoccaceae archaeon]|nr:hypothetical protein [Methanomassiliicoccaceae archaeon]